MATYFELKQMIENGSITSFNEWFEHIDLDQFTAATNMTAKRLNALRLNPCDFKLKEIMQIGALLDIDPKTLSLLFIKNCLTIRQ